MSQELERVYTINLGKVLKRHKNMKIFILNLYGNEIIADEGVIGVC